MSDHSGHSEASHIQAFNGDNYQIWSFQMRALFLGKDLMGVVDGSEPKPAATDAMALAAWVKKDSQGYFLLSQALDLKRLELVMSCTTSNEIWEILKTLHDQRANESVHNLTVKFFAAKMETCDTIASFLGKIELLKSQLVCMGETNITDKSLMAKVLGNLPDEFAYFHSSWDSTATADKTLNNLLIRLIREETRMKEMKEREASASPTSAFVAQAKRGDGTSRPSLTYEQRQARKKDLDKRKKTAECWKCGKVGHYHRDCTEPDKKENTTSAQKTAKPGTTTNHWAYMATL